MRYTFLAIAFFLTFKGFSQQTNTYQSYDAPVANPERGFYHHTEVNSTGYNLLNFGNLVDYRQEENITQIVRVFYLNQFVNKAISKEYLDNMHQDFNIIRAAGAKIIVRFAYTKRSTAPYRDATPEMVRNHIFQLKEVLTTHSDVIAAVQAGFIGAWGEWYYTDHFANGQPWIVSAENWIDRGNVVKDLLRVLPKDRMVQMRTPNQKMTIFDTELPITSSMAFSGEDISRAAHHNDCFVASGNDVGTYIDIPLEKPYLEEETKYLAMGGETCGVSSPYSDCDNAYQELQRFHWSYLNIDYHPGVLDSWQTQGCFDNIELNLGYRYILEDATLQTEVHPDGIFDLSVNLENHGFANPYNPRDLEIILKSTTTDQVYRLQTEEAIRFWPIQQSYNFNIQAGFPDGIIEDTYDVFLNLPDKSPILKNNPNYSIRISNMNVWNADEGWNDLGFQLIINASFPSTSYQGNLLFQSLSLNEVIVPGPTAIYAGTNESTALLFWGRTENYNYRNIDRSTDGVNFETISALSASNDFYKIIDNSNDYYYRFALMGDNGTVSYSDTIFVSASTATTSQIDITTDGIDADWKDILPTATMVNGTNESFVLRTHFSIDKARFALYGGVNDYVIYLNTDNSITTGTNQPSLLEGMDYKLQNDSLFRYENNQWLLESTDVVSSNEDIYEIELNHSLFQNIDDNFLIPIVGYYNDNSIQLSENDIYPAMHIRHLPPDLPLNFEVLNSVSFPEERLEIHWEKCLYCEGYILEYSEDGVSFNFLENPDPEDEVFYHDFLPNGTHYYRIKSYNILGETQYSAIKSATMGPTSTIEVDEPETIIIWPNPTKQYIYTEKVYEKAFVRNVLGEVIQTHLYNGNPIDLSKHNEGVYFITFRYQGKESIKKVIKL